VPASVTVAVKVSSSPAQRVVVFALIVTKGFLTVSVVVFCVPLQKPLASVVVAVIVVSPAAIVFIKPVVSLIVATVVLDEDHFTVGL
jgi:hypothetical protein